MTATRYTAQQGRRFALTVAGAFAVIAAISFWRGHRTAPIVFLTIAAVLAVAGLVAPAQLGPVESGWMKLAHAISKVTTPLFMGIVYFVVLTPIGLIRRTLGSNPMVHRADNGSYWISRLAAERETARRRMERQF